MSDPTLLDTPGSPPAAVSRPAGEPVWDDAGWNASFRLVQPRNLASWIFIGYLVMGVILTARYFRPSFDVVGTATIGGAIVFALYGIPWFLFLRHIDRWTRIPGKLVFWAMMWGGFAATFAIALPANTALLSIYTKTISASFTQDWGAGLVAPFSEELGKGIGILLLMAIAPYIIRSPFDGFVVGAFVGLGFQLSEDVLYVVNQAVSTFGANNVGAIVQVGLIRMLVGLFSHTLFSAVFGTGLVYLVGTDRTPTRRGLGLLLILLAMLAHGVWDNAAAIAGVLGVNPLVTMLLTALVELVIILVVLRIASRGERKEVEALMAPEVDRGTITAPELSALSGTARERRHFVKHHTGYSSKAKARHILAAAGDLARARTLSNGTETPAVAFARSEIERVRATS